MALRYDFDMGPAPVEARRRAMFRDPNTVAALQSADPVVQDFFEASGFDLSTYESGAPEGHFPAGDEEARTLIIGKLTANLKTYALKGADFGGFDFPTFLRTIGQARPMEMAVTPPHAAAPAPAPAEAALRDVFTSAPAADASPSPPPVRETSRPTGLTDEERADLIRARMASQRQKGMRSLAFGGLMLGLVLLFYVATRFL